jgi:hypothetical protein
LTAEIQKLVHRIITARAPKSNRIPFPGNHPVSLTRSNVRAMTTRHLVSWKAVRGPLPLRLLFGGRF